MESKLCWAIPFWVGFWRSQRRVRGAGPASPGRSASDWYEDWTFRPCWVDGFRRFLRWRKCDRSIPWFQKNCEPRSWALAESTGWSAGRNVPSIGATMFRWSHRWRRGKNQQSPLRSTPEPIKRKTIESTLKATCNQTNFLHFYFVHRGDRYPTLTWRIKALDRWKKNFFWWFTATF